MVIENIMYFALGMLVAGLVALVILPAVWKRAVRLTKRRIEAATPITMAEFRADKDQLRAEFALSTRRLEMNVETLRKRLAEQLGDVNQKRSDLGALKVEREKHLGIVKELEAREAELRARVLELERDGTDLAQRLRMRDRELETRNGEVEALRETVRGGLPRAVDLAGTGLSGDYDRDIDRLTAALAVEHRRAAFLEEQAHRLLSRLDTSDRRGADSTAAIDQMREALGRKDDRKAANDESLTVAEARMASAETRLNALLAETSQTVPQTAGKVDQSLADKLTVEAEVESLRKKVLKVEDGLVADWNSDRLDEAGMRERLGDIAATVSRLVYTADPEAQPASEGESLFDRVQRFADGEGPTAGERRGSVTDRMAALREIQER